MRLFLHLGPFLVLALSGVLLSRPWSHAAMRWLVRSPAHWNARGEVDRWLERTPSSGLRVVAAGALACLLLWLLGVSIRRFSSQSAGDGEQSGVLDASANTLLASQYFIAITVAGAILLPHLGFGAGASLALSLAASLMVLALSGWFFVRAGVFDRAPDPKSSAQERWRWGVFYYHRGDRALFVEKRSGLGYTINFAHPGAPFFIVTVFAALLVLILGFQ